MDVKPYDELSATEILGLCIWREARGEILAAKRAVTWSIRNRVDHPRWWNLPQGTHPTLWHSTILKPWQYSSFNSGDPNETRWPMSDTDENYGDCRILAETMLAIMAAVPGVTDPTDGATHYYDRSITFPKAWGNEADWDNTLNLGRIRFWKEKPHGPIS